MRIVRITLLTCLALAASCASAWAHAQLQSTRPGDGATVPRPVHHVTLRFNEQIRVAFGGVRVFDPTGHRVDSGAATVRGTTVRIPVDTNGGAGTYAVAYRIVSADGHAVRGAYTYDVRSSSGNSTSRDAALKASQGSRVLDGVLKALRGMVLLALMIAAGGAIFVAAAAPGRSPVWYRSALLVALLAALAAALVDAAIAGGFSIVEAARWAVVREEVSSAWGTAAVLIAAAAVIALVVQRWLPPGGGPSSARRWWAAAPATIALLMGSLGGHAIASGVIFVRLPLDMLHQLAAAIWLGGLIQLVAYLRRSDDDIAVVAAVVARYSTWALASVVVLVLTGVYAALVEIGTSVDAWTTTTYGRLVLVKIVVLIGAMPLAWLNRSRNVPALSAASAGSSPAEPGEASAVRHRLRTYACIEVVMIVFVVAATGWLVQSIPARDAVVPKPVSQTQKLRGGASLQLDIDPAMTGRNEMHVYVYNAQGNLDASVTTLVARADNTAARIDALPIPLVKAAPGHWTTPGAIFPLAGAWSITMQVTRGTFNQEATVMNVKIAPRRRTS